MTRLILFEIGCKAANPVLFQALDTDLFLDRRWYGSDGEKITGERVENFEDGE